VVSLLACHDGPGRATAVAALDSDTGGAIDSALDTTPDTGHTPDTAVTADTADTAQAEPIELVARIEVIARSPSGVATPPTWNANLPKLAGDGLFYYAVHTWYADDASQRYAEILSRPSDGGEWSVLATVDMPHQPPGLLIDEGGRLHLAFACQRPGDSDVTCFAGGAGTQGNSRRFYHLVFEARAADGRYDPSTYGNWDEFTGPTNGYLGLGTTPDGTTWGSLADESWRRVVWSWGPGGEVDELATLDVSPYYLLYPVHAALSVGEYLLFGGLFDPGGGGNAAYDAAVALSGNGSGFTALYQVAPGGDASLAAFPGDALLDEAGTTLLSYLDDGACDTLLATDVGESSEVEVRLGCLGTYAKLHRDGDTLWLLSPSATTEWVIASSPDGGLSWSWATIPVEGLDPDDTVLTGFTLIRPDTAPLAHDPAVIRFFASGLDSSSLATRSYFGELRLR
jgi:hypothetical protein